MGTNKKTVLKNLRLSIRPGDRVGILGRNGAGKSTLLRALANELPLLSGERIAGEHLKPAYFAQHQVDDLDLDASPLLHLSRARKEATDQEIRDFLGGFNFSGDRVEESTRIFSGGEKARLALALIAWSRPNLLFLDEPTNHLDIEMRQALIFALQEFQGGLIIISHDRHLLRSCVNEFWLVEDGELASFDEDIQDYQPGPGKDGLEASASDPVRDSRKKRQQQAAMRDRLRPGKKRLELLENQIKTVQETLDRIQHELSASDIYEEERKADLQAILKEQGSLQVELQEKELAWFRTQEELDELAANLVNENDNE